MPPGTSITVSDLFGNLPARRKFLKSPSAESTRIHELISRYALAYPDIRFQLLAGGRQVLATPGSGRREEGLLAVYGREVADRMLEVSVSDPDTGYGMDGFVSAPDLHRANRTYMSLFVNRRWIQNRMLAFALEEAYHGLLPDKRYPLAVLNLTLPYAEVDVNCHPAKREVRFHHEGTVYSTLQRAVRAALVADSPVPLMGGRGGLAAPASDGGATAEQRRAHRVSSGALSTGQTPGNLYQPAASQPGRARRPECRRDFQPRPMRQPRLNRPCPRCGWLVRSS